MADCDRSADRGGGDRAGGLHRRLRRRPGRGGGDRDPERVPAAARRRAALSAGAAARVPAPAGSRRGDAAGSRSPHGRRPFGQLVLVGPGRRPRGRRLRDRAGGDLGHQRRRQVHPQGDRAVARRSGERVQTDVPGLVFLEIDGLALPVLRRAMRDGSAPNMARWVAEGSHRLVEWETDLSSQTGASQAGILLGSNDDIPAFRWVEKESGRLMTCSSPADCAEIERRHAGGGLLVGAGRAAAICSRARPTT